MAAGFSRRKLLGWTGAGAAVAGVGAVSGYAAGHSSPAASNAPYRRDPGLGQTGYDPDDELAAGEVGTAGTTQKDIIKEYLSRPTRPR